MGEGGGRKEKDNVDKEVGKRDRNKRIRENKIKERRDERKT